MVFGRKRIIVSDTYIVIEENLHVYNNSVSGKLFIKIMTYLTVIWEFTRFCHPIDMISTIGAT